MSSLRGSGDVFSSLFLRFIHSDWSFIILGEHTKVFLFVYVFCIWVVFQNADSGCLSWLDQNSDWTKSYLSKKPPLPPKNINDSPEVRPHWHCSWYWFKARHNDSGMLRNTCSPCNQVAGAFVEIANQQMHCFSGRGLNHGNRGCAISAHISSTFHRPVISSFCQLFWIWVHIE